jgi:hypothetical protein
VKQLLSSVFLLLSVDYSKRVKLGEMGENGIPKQREFLKVETSADMTYILSSISAVIFWIKNHPETRGN